MARKFREARQMKKLKVIEAAALLGVSQPTLSAWEGGRKSPTIDNLLAMAELYGVTTDYLLGRTEAPQGASSSSPLTAETLRIRNGQPVWSPKYGWLLVDSAANELLRSDGTRLPLMDSGELYVMPPAFADAETPEKKPLQKDALRPGLTVWVEPISPDPALRSELRGWYQIYDDFAENKSGNRFLLCTYTAKWLAFEEA